MRLPKIASCALVLLLTSCASTAPMIEAPTRGVLEGASPGPAARATAAVIGAELAARRGDAAQAAELYLAAAVITDDEALADRATRLAFSVNENELALRAAALWRELASDNRDAHSLYLRARVAQGEASLGDIEQWLASAPNPAEAEQQIAALLAAASPDADKVLGMLAELENKRDSAALAYTIGLLALRYERPAEALEALSRARARGYSALACDELALRIHLANGDDGQASAVLASMHTQADFSEPQALNIGQLLLESEAWALAEMQFEFNLSRWPDNPAAHLALGLLAAQDGNDKRAASHFTALWDKGERKDEAAWQMGRLHSRAARWESAAKWFARVEPGSRWFDARLGLIQAVARQGRMLEARSRLAVLRAEQPDQAERLWQAEAELLQAGGLSADALEVLAAGINETQSLDLYYVRALVHERSGNFAAAKTDLQFIIDQDPQNAQALNALGYMLADHGHELPRARELIEAALSLRPGDPAIRDSLGWVLFRVGEVDSARQWLSEAYADFPDPEIAAHLGEVLWVLGEREQALQIWDEARQRDPGNDTLKNTVERLTQP